MVSANFMRTALSIAVSPFPIPIPMTLSVDERNTLTTNVVDRIKNKMLQEYEKTLIQKNRLEYDRHNSRFIFLRTTPGRAAYINADQAEYWYRAMEEPEFLKLKSNNEFAGTDKYGGISNCRNYSAKYVTNETDANIIVEWHIPRAGRLHQLMSAAGIQYKPESDGISYGLGVKGTNANLGPDAAFKVFNEYCGLTFKVVDLRIPIRVPQLL